MQLVKIWFIMVFFATTWGCVPNTPLNAPSNDSTTSTAGSTAEDRISDAHPSDQSADLTIGTAGSTVKDMVDGLGYRLQLGADTDQAVGALALHGDVAVSEMERQLVDGNVDFGWRHDAVRVLNAINSEMSRALLRRIALGEFEDNSSWAARNLIACDPSEASNLLVSTTPQVLAAALDAMEGQPIDDRLLALLKKCLSVSNKDNVGVSQEQLLQISGGNGENTAENTAVETNELQMLYWRISSVQLVRCRAAEVMVAGTSGKLAEEAVVAVGEVLNTIADVPGIDATIPDDHGIEFTWGEHYYRNYIGVLVRAKVENRSIHDLIQQLHGRAKDAAILALAQRGDKSVHKELIRLAQDAQSGLFQAWAARALGEIGTQGDLPFLRTLAENDPLIRKGQLIPGGGSADPTYPVREAAKAAIRAIEARASKETDK